MKGLAHLIKQGGATTLRHIPHEERLMRVYSKLYYMAEESGGEKIPLKRAEDLFGKAFSSGFKEALEKFGKDR